MCVCVCSYVHLVVCFVCFRCEFNYVNIDAGELEISRGDILNVVDTMHEDRTDSWYAFKMKGSQRTTTGGIIPSKNRY